MGPTISSVLNKKKTIMNLFEMRCALCTRCQCRSPVYLTRKISVKMHWFIYNGNIAWGFDAYLNRIAYRGATVCAPVIVSICTQSSRQTFSMTNKTHAVYNKRHGTGVKKRKKKRMSAHTNNQQQQRQQQQQQ